MMVVIMIRQWVVVLMLTLMMHLVIEHLIQEMILLNYLLDQIDSTIKKKNLVMKKIESDM